MAEFAIKVDYQPNETDPVKLFQGISTLVQSFKDIDTVLANNIPIDIEPQIVLEDIEQGSILVKLAADFLDKKVPDESLNSLDWKPLLGQFLVQAKYAIINYSNEKEAGKSKKSIASLTDSVQKEYEKYPELAEKIGMKKISNFEAIKALNAISTANEYFSKDNKVEYITKESKANFNLDFKVDYESLEDLMIDKTLRSESRVILKVKRPDFIGESKWDFKHGKSAISAKICDEDWLKKFKNREIPILPNDSMEVTIESISSYDSQGELIKQQFNILIVHEVK